VAPLAGADQAYPPMRPNVPAPIAAAQNLPLAGIRIVDFSMGWAGPLATRQLADLGAEVIKVESCQHPDWWRGADNRPVFVEQRMYEMRPNFLVENRNKLGITLDLTSPEGAALARRLVARADAVVENFARGAMTKLGLHYTALRAVRPDLVMLSMPAFPSGAWEQGRAYGFTLEQAVGMPSIAGPEGAPPMLTHCAFGDPISGLNGAAALLTALLHRKRTGQGQLIDLAQIHCMLPMIAPWLIAQSVDGDSGPRRGNRHPVHAPHDCYPCVGDDQWVWIAVTDDAMWQRLCKVTGRPDLGKFASAPDRHAQADAIDAALAAWTRLHTADAAMQILQSAAVAAGVVRSPFDLAADPHLVATGFFQPTDHPCYGPHQQPSLSLRESTTPYPVRHRSPLLGEHNTEVLGKMLGLSATELASLAERRVIGTVPIVQGQ
jgi:crotonobetainyl-CoA:carnitine CoA-transferase CaiB-like acyl-CoA transferase